MANEETVVMLKVFFLQTNSCHLVGVVQSLCWFGQVGQLTVILIFGHHFRNLLIPTFMVVTILLLIINISFNHILLCLASFDLYCGSFAVYRMAVLIASGAVRAIQHILWLQLFLAIFINGIFVRNILLWGVLSKMMFNDLEFKCPLIRH